MAKHSGEKYLSPAEKVELLKKQKSSVLLSTFESYARRNPIISEDLELLRAELLLRLAKADGKEVT